MMQPPPPKLVPWKKDWISQNFSSILNTDPLLQHIYVTKSPVGDVELPIDKIRGFTLVKCSTRTCPFDECYYPVHEGLTEAEMASRALDIIIIGIQTKYCGFCCEAQYCETAGVDLQLEEDESDTDEAFTCRLCGARIEFYLSENFPEDLRDQTVVLFSIHRDHKTCTDCLERLAREAERDEENI
jgi:hypothetical protein